MAMAQHVDLTVDDQGTAHLRIVTDENSLSAEVTKTQLKQLAADTEATQ